MSSKRSTMLVSIGVVFSMAGVIIIVSSDVAVGIAMLVVGIGCLVATGVGARKAGPPGAVAQPPATRSNP